MPPGPCPPEPVLPARILPFPPVSESDSSSDMAVMVIAGPAPACIIRMPAFDGNGKWKLVSEPVVSASDFLLAGGDPKKREYNKKTNC